MKHLFLYGYGSGLASAAALVYAWKGVKALYTKVVVALANKVTVVAKEVETKV